MIEQLDLYKRLIDCFKSVIDVIFEKNARNDIVVIEMLFLGNV